MKYDYDYLFSLIDYSDYYDLYPEYSNAIVEGENYYFNTYKQASEWADMVIDVFNSLQNKEEIRVYRAVYLKNKNDLKYDDLGESWSFDKNSAIEFGFHNNSNYLLSGIVYPYNIDWEESIKLFVKNSFDMFSGESENELYIPYAEEKIYDLKIEKIK